jgi:hypothetical protein
MEQLSLTRQLRQLGDIRRDPARLVVGQRGGIATPSKYLNSA